MSTIAQQEAAQFPEQAKVPPLRNGDRLSAEEFERRFDAMPGLKNAELINGVVYMVPPISLEDHASPHFNLIGWLFAYTAATPGVRGGDNSTIRLPQANRPQPDACLFILPTHGGQTQIDADGYLVGTPELVAEVSATSASYDLHDKLDVYRQYGAREYLVWRVYDRAIDWFVLRGQRYERLSLSPEGHYRSDVLPGLWLDVAALVAGDLARVLRVAQQGLASPEHADFVARLRAVAPPRT
jgi:Uma2 family endonuclease